MADYPSSRIIQLSNGKIEGRRLIHEGDKQVDAFQGIPFAAPPVGELRFKRAEAVSPWEGIKETKEFGGRSIQIAISPDDFHKNGIPSEDCLYLNVFTPCWESNEKAGFPVMIFIHGGAFECGDTQSYGDINICKNIVTRGVLFVTIQYRVGYLGFFSTGDKVCPGNLGLWDQTEALKWVQNNIEAFGGNKNNVTLLGQSAGSASVDFLHLSPHSTDLFHKMICMAGSSHCRWASNSKMVEHSRKKAARLGITNFDDSTKLIEELRKFPAQDFAVNMFNREKDGEADFETVPYLEDGNFFPEPIDILRSKATPKPIITGVTKEEGILMVVGMEMNEETATDITRRASRGVENREKVMKEIHNRYIGNTSYEDNGKLALKIVKLASDYFFNSGTLQLCRNTVRVQDDPVYLYTFPHWNPQIMEMVLPLMPVKDSTHSCELFYFFSRGVLGTPSVVTEDDRRVMEEYTIALTNFARFGDPNGLNDDLHTHWNPIDKDNYSRNFVFDALPTPMKEEFFEGRTAEYIKMVEESKKE